MTPDELLALVDETVENWAVVKDDIQVLPDHLYNRESIQWIIHYRRAKGWYKA